ncbi:hypothetical protein BuS5_01792 [Desulfosarcina sp. BuS5]|uniref:helix-turn-helix domain-containing protein n=1 Tax=Desulfosarcina sp. BuS5 TaxID=933262 RepID=UPI00047F3711|nr:helix-turn-helix domain-containing protein [Desulfosarcina sp. BuS5]WDN88824.1 hypothetical protein BuS5_01792 [Desulfosarcina sp. BuS5]
MSMNAALTLSFVEHFYDQGQEYYDGIKIQADHIGWNEALTEKSLSLQEIDLLPYREAKVKIMEQFNTAYIAKLLSKTGGNVTRAARLCGMERQLLQ